MSSAIKFELENAMYPFMYKLNPGSIVAVVGLVVPGMFLVDSSVRFSYFPCGSGGLFPLSFLTCSK